MNKVTVQQFKEIVQKLTPEPPQQRMEGLYDVLFSYEDEYYLMVTVNKATGKVSNFYWQIIHDDSETFTDLFRAKQQSYQKLADLAESACMNL